MGKFYAGVTEDLILYARQLAWFSSVPKKEKIDNKFTRKTRFETLTESGASPSFPDVGEAFYIVRYWSEAGRSGQGFNGPVPLTWQEIAAWAHLLGLWLMPYELQAIRAMSEAYVDQWHKSQAPECPPPYGDVDILVNRQAVSEKIGRLFRSRQETGE